jgi:hypothetical protein
MVFCRFYDVWNLTYVENAPRMLIEISEIMRVGGGGRKARESLTNPLELVRYILYRSREKSGRLGKMGTNFVGRNVVNNVTRRDGRGA